MTAIKIGALGCGSIASAVHIPQLTRSPDYEVVALAEPDAARREAVIQHYHAMTLRGFWKQHFTYGQGAHGFHTAEARYAQSSIRLEPPAFYVNMLRYPLARVPGWRGAVVSALIGLSQAASATGFFVERRRWKRTSA